MGPIEMELTLQMKSTWQGDPNAIESLAYQIVKENEQFDENNGNSYLDCGAFDTSCTRYAKQPGKWKLRAIVYYDENSPYGEQTVYSNEVNLEIIFPKIDDIVADGGIQNEMDQTWQATKDAASSSGRHEKAFIYMQILKMIA